MSKGIKTGVVGIITGASTGIGKAMALDLAKRYKAKLAINARNQSDLDATAKEIESLGGQAVTAVGDISSTETISALIEACKSSFGPAELLVNNAGLAKPGYMDAITPDDWRYVFEVNFFAPLQLTYALLPHFQERREGKIVNIASVAGKVAFPGSVCYASSKFALTGFSEGMAAELGPKGIDIITVCPGLVRTEFFRKNKNPQDVTAMGEQADIKGWLVRNVLSISSEQASKEIIQACEKGGCHEIVLTGPGKFIERLNGICPPVAWQASRLVRPDRR